MLDGRRDGPAHRPPPGRAGLRRGRNLRAGRRGSLADLAFRPPFTFFKMYLLRKGFLDGSFGLTLSGLYAIYTYVKYAKLREMNQR